MVAKNMNKCSKCTHTRNIEISIQIQLGKLIEHYSKILKYGALDAILSFLLNLFDMLQVLNCSS